MNDQLPLMRRDLEFFPVQQGDQQMILIKDHLGLVREGQGIALQLYQFMALLDGTKNVRDLQMELMRQRGGVLVESDEVNRLLEKLDEFYLLDSDNFKSAQKKIVADFAVQEVRPCSHCGRSYPHSASELKERLDEILTGEQQVQAPDGKITALVAPHIDLNAGAAVYASAYQILNDVAPSKVILLGTGHRLMNKLFCLTDKDFETPLGIIKSESNLIQELREAGKDVVADDDFAHRSEHSIEFQIIFLQHLFGSDRFTIIPVLCGSILTCLPEYQRSTYREKAGPFLQKLKSLIDKDTLVLAGVDFSHIGLKFGHDRPAEYIENQAMAHDRNLLKYLSHMDTDQFWQESINIQDGFNVCGFPALACMLEVLPSGKGKVLNYYLRHEKPTQSAVSFAAVVFTRN
ncbi:MAG: AmmeMemoRadiSam system protein B [Planctomycetota bacterium]|jgi:AmmeMemoRadiSam system protein B